MSGPFLSIIGIGEDGVAGLSPVAQTALREAQLVIGGARHLALADTLITGTAETWPRPIQSAIARIQAARATKVAVLASGDPFFYGVGKMLAEAFQPSQWRCFPGISSVALACARLGWAQNEVEIVSLCGRPLAHLARVLWHGAKLMVLSEDASTPRTVADFLAARGFGHSEITLLEALGGPEERIRTRVAGNFDLVECNTLNLLAITLHGGPNAALVPGRHDSLFAHDGQITKHDIRAITLAALAPRPGALLWDVGTGSGSVAIEFLLAHRSTRAIGIDRNAERLTRAGQNAQTLGVPELQLLQGEAPAAFNNLPTPDAIFLGGGAHLPGVIAAASAALASGGRLVANAIALDTQAALIAALARQGGTLSRIGVERLDKVGRMQVLRPAMTVVQYVWIKP